MLSLIQSSNGGYNKLWKILESEKHLSKEQFREALTQAKRENRYLSEILLAKPELPQQRLLSALAQFFQIPEIRLKQMTISPLVLNLIPKEIAEQHSVVIFKKIKDVIYVATTAPENVQTIEFIRKKTGYEPQIFLTTPEDIHHTLRRYKSELASEFDRIIEDSMQEALSQHDSAEKMAYFVPMIKMVNAILENAIIQRASDIHCEPNGVKVTIRFRIDGILQKILILPKEIQPPLIARIKLMANLKIDEHRQPQDGRFNFVFNDRDIAVRVSVVPTLYGSKIVMRMLDAQEQQFSMLKLGFNKHDYKHMRKEAAKPHGMILVTGPTGSGKTTTLYTLMRRLNKDSVNICTIEDPIEYGLEGINQTQISSDGGITFVSGLRSLLRQDPDIIMVGEVRDGETANIGVNAAMTGHLVLSTLHTNSAFLTPQRLVEMGVQPYLAASVINCIIGQRLVRQVCKNCRSYSRLSSKSFDKYRDQHDFEEIIAKLRACELLPADATVDTVKIASGRGCVKCGGLGYRGRIGIYEVLKIEPSIGQLILQGASSEKIRQEASKQGTLTMLEDGMLKVFTSQTTFEEVMRVTAE